MLKSLFFRFEYCAGLIKSIVITVIIEKTRLIGLGISSVFARVFDIECKNEQNRSFCPFQYHKISAANAPINKEIAIKNHAVAHWNIEHFCSYIRY
jgi:hypothetical protein